MNGTGLRISVLHEMLSLKACQRFGIPWGQKGLSDVWKRGSKERWRDCSRPSSCRWLRGTLPGAEDTCAAQHCKNDPFRRYLSQDFPGGNSEGQSHFEPRHPQFWVCHLVMGIMSAWLLGASDFKIKLRGLHVIVCFSHTG